LRSDHCLHITNLRRFLFFINYQVFSLGALFAIASPRDQQVLLDIFLKKIVAGLGGAGAFPDSRRAASISNVAAALCISLQQMMLTRGVLAVPAWIVSAQSACLAAIMYGARCTQLTAAHGLALLVQLNTSEGFLKDTLSKLMGDAAVLAQSYGWVLAPEARVQARLGCVHALAAVACGAGAARTAVYLPDILECNPAPTIRRVAAADALSYAGTSSSTWMIFPRTSLFRGSLVLQLLCGRPPQSLSPASSQRQIPALSTPRLLYHLLSP
jgi:hypothetical protein